MRREFATEAIARHQLAEAQESLDDYLDKHPGLRTFSVSWQHDSGRTITIDVRPTEAPSCECAPDLENRHLISCMQRRDRARVEQLEKELSETKLRAKNAEYLLAQESPEERPSAWRESPWRDVFRDYVPFSKRPRAMALEEVAASATASLAAYDERYRSFLNPVQDPPDVARMRAALAALESSSKEQG